MIGHVHIHADDNDDAAEQRRERRRRALAALLLFAPWKKLRMQIAVAAHDFGDYFDAVDAALETASLSTALKSGVSTVGPLTKLIRASMIGGYQDGGALVGLSPGSRYADKALRSAQQRADEVSQQMLTTSRKWLKMNPGNEFALSSARAERVAKFEAARWYYTGLQQALWGHGMLKGWLTTSDAPCEECFVDGTMVRTGPLKSAFVRERTGEFVSLVLSNGNVLTGTANHPILTGSGWKPMRLIDETDYLFDSRIAERILFGNAHYFDDAESRIEDITDLSQWRHVAIRTAGLAHHFHGDISNGEVYTKAANSFLKTQIRKVRKEIDRSLARISVKRIIRFFGTRRVHNLSSDCGFYSAEGIIAHNCLDNEDQGPIAMEDVFQSGDDAPLAHLSCQCVLEVVPAESI